MTVATILTQGEIEALASLAEDAPDLRFDSAYVEPVDTATLDRIVATIEALRERADVAEAQLAVNTKMIDRFVESGAENWIGWVVEHEGLRFELSVRLVGARSATEHIVELTAILDEARKYMQHPWDCGKCRTCGGVRDYVPHVATEKGKLYPYEYDPHPLDSEPCSCGLDALLARIPKPVKLDAFRERFGHDPEPSSEPTCMPMPTDVPWAQSDDKTERQP